MAIFMWIIAIIAALCGTSGLIELSAVKLNANATVLQEISARLVVGLCFLIFACAAGFACVIQALGKRVTAPAAGPNSIKNELPAASIPPTKADALMEKVGGGDALKVARAFAARQER